MPVYWRAPADVAALVDEIEHKERVTAATQLEDGNVMLFTERRPSSGPKNRETR